MERSNVQTFKLVQNKTNVGFGKSINNGVVKATRDLILLLNDDVVLINDNYKNALKLFDKDPQLFAVSFAQKEKNNIRKKSRN